jgi:CelD/BcsL family acetyltransferase involved in cellulose biosynthesis
VSRLERVPLDDPLWTSFVADRREATPFHQPVWTRLLCDCYGYRGFALVLVDNGVPVAGMPVVEKSAPLTGRRQWASLPFTDHCAPLVAADGVDESFAAAVDEFRAASGVDRLEVRAPMAVGTGRRASFAVVHTLHLQPDAREVLSRVKKSEAQHAARAKRKGVTVRAAESVEDVDRVFYALQLETRRRLGVPIQPRRFYTLLWQRMLEPGHGSLLLAYHEDLPIAGAIFLRGGGTVVWKYGASLRSHWKLHPNPLILWTAIEQACTSGAKVLDFGRTELGHDGLMVFKRSWGAEETPLTYTVLGRTSTKARSQRPRAAAEELIRRAPPWVCRAAGEVLYKYAS